MLVHDRRQAAAFHEIHRIELLALDLACLVNGNDVRMLQLAAAAASW